MLLFFPFTVIVLEGDDWHVVLKNDELHRIEVF